MELPKIKATPTREQRQIHRRLWLSSGSSFVVCLVAPQALFQAGYRSLGLTAAGLALPLWFFMAGRAGDRIRTQLTDDQNFDGFLVFFLCCCVLLGSLLFLILRFLAYVRAA